MFDLSWSHIGLFVVIALLVLGPKELPNAIRTGAQLLRAGRKLAGEFRSGVDELMREAELDETRRSIKQAVTEGLDKTVGEAVDPSGELMASLENPLIETNTAEANAAATTAEAKLAELAGPPNIVINDPPPAPPNSIVPPPPPVRRRSPRLPRRSPVRLLRAKPKPLRRRQGISRKAHDLGWG
jgi:sec-independent protein translocase protein TatB